MSYRRLPKSQEENLLVALCRAIAAIKNPIEASQLVKDLLTEHEGRIISKRLEVARLLIRGLDYEQIRPVLKVSHPTIAKVSLWLQTSGEGFRTVLSRIKQTPKLRVEKEKWGSLKRRYPQYFWPQILLEQVIVSANKKELEKIKSTLGRLKEKSELISNINKLVSDQLRRR